MRPGAALLLLAWLALGPPAAEGSTRQPILVTMKKVVDELAAAQPGATRPGRRLALANGLLGVGPYQPPGGTDFGLKAPPLSLFPRAGLGNSLNVDPNTGRPY